MNYLLLLYVDPEIDMPKEADAIAMHVAVGRRAVQDGAYLGCNALEGADQARTLRVRGADTTVTDGPFAETKEFLAGYYLLNCENVDQAIEYAKGLPRTGSVEIRPIMEIPNWNAMIGLEPANATA